jgi:TonB family protein
MTTEHAIVNLFSYSVQITLVVAVAAGLPRLLRVSAPVVHHAFWRAVLIACLALPFVQPWRTAATAPHARTTGAGALRPAESDVSVIAPDDAGAAARDGGRAVLWIVIAGALCRAAWVTVGLLRLRRRSAALDTDASAEFDDVQRQLRTRASIRWSRDAQQAVTFGLRRPVVLLPESLQALEPAALRAVVAHELFHVQRRDWAWLVAQEAVRAVFWFHPAMWWLVSRVQLARETVVDELSILFTNARRTYLDTLLALADDSPFSSSSAFSQRRHLFHRVMLLSKEGSMSSIRVVAASAVLVVGVAGAALSAARAFPLQRAGAAPSSAATAQVPPRDPLSPEAHHLKAATLLEKVQKDPTLSAEARAAALKEMVDAEDRALSLNPDYVPALIYKNLALRMQAATSTDPQEQQRLIEQANELRDKALALRRAAGIPDPPFANAAVPPPPAYQAALDRLHPLHVGGNMQTPVKTRDVKAVYPPDAKAAGVQGVVILEAIVNGDGKIEDARVLRSVPELDAAALEAVRQWEYLPTLMNGQPVAILMTVTVNFTLQ